MVKQKWMLDGFDFEEANKTHWTIKGILESTISNVGWIIMLLRHLLR